MILVDKFLSTPSARRATTNSDLRESGQIISIHALREEGDGGALFDTAEDAVISIHALREEGDVLEVNKRGRNVEFLSTPSARRATTNRLIGRTGFVISIHALREEGDPVKGFFIGF